MASSARQALSAFRNDPMQLTFEVIGIDLTDATMAFAIKLAPDTPGAPLIDGPLTKTTTPGAAGIRVVTVETVEGVPVSALEIIDTKAHMQALPAADPGEESRELAYDLQWSVDDGSEFTPLEQTRLFGPFIVMGSING